MIKITSTSNELSGFSEDEINSILTYNSKMARSIGWYGRVIAKVSGLGTASETYTLKAYGLEEMKDFADGDALAAGFKPEKFAEAVASFQEEADLPATGKIDKETWNLLIRVFKVQPEYEKLTKEHWYKQIPWYGWTAIGLFGASVVAIALRKKIGLGEFGDTDTREEEFTRALIKTHREIDDHYTRRIRIDDENNCMYHLKSALDLSANAVRLAKRDNHIAAAYLNAAALLQSNCFNNCDMEESFRTDEDNEMSRLMYQLAAEASRMK